MEGLDSRGNLLISEKNGAINEVLDRYFKGAYEWDINGILHFAFSDGISECLHEGKHQLAISSGIWYNSPGLFAVSTLYICSSAMEALAFAALQDGKLADLDQYCWMVFGLNCRLPHAIPEFCFGRKIKLLFGRELLDILRAVKICVALKGFTVRFHLRGERLECSFRGRSYVFSIEGFSLSRFKQATGFRDYSRMKRPFCADSFLDQLRFGR